VRSRRGLRSATLFLIFTIEYDRPTGRKGTVVYVEIEDFEIQTTKHGRNGECLAIGKVDYRGRHLLQYDNDVVDMLLQHSTPDPQPSTCML
jgi:hypothetical protein